jgi:hypothetical protein
MKIAPPYRWDGDVDGTWFLRQRVGGILRHGSFPLYVIFLDPVEGLPTKTLQSKIPTQRSVLARSRAARSARTQFGPGHGGQY